MSRSIKRYSLITCLLWSFIASGDPLTLTITFTGITNTNIPLRVLLFNKADGFPAESDKALLRKVISATTAQLTFENLEPGTYAVSVFQDLNGNGRCDTKWPGIPTEPYGMSGYTTQPFLFPRFNRARFELKTERTTISIPLLQ